MKWYKHISDSLDDPDVFELMTEHGANGYLVHFGILEIYAREFKTDPGWKLEVSLAYLKSKLRIYHTNVLLILLQSLENICKWEVNLSDKKVNIFVPNFLKWLDESTLKKMREVERKTGKRPEQVPPKPKPKKQPKPEPKNLPVLAPSNEAIKLTELLIERIKIQNPGTKEKTPGQIKAWEKEMEKMLIEDNRDPREAWLVIRWVFEKNLEGIGGFVVRAPSTLRKKYDDIVSAIGSQNKSEEEKQPQSYDSPEVRAGIHEMHQEKLRKQAEKQAERNAIDAEVVEDE